MVTLAIIGSGNVAQHLIQAFTKSNEMELVQVFSRNKEAVSHLLSKDKITTEFSTLKEVDVYILAVSDDAIASVSSKIPYENRLVVHTSGSVPMAVLEDKNRKGIFYPLQTFSKNKALNFEEIPICLECQNEVDSLILEKMAKSISKKVYNFDSDQRKALHVSAVFVNNFVNHLYQIGNEICKDHRVPFEILQPLILETANKIMVLSPNESQTGPAKRNDTETINSHLAFLLDENQKEIYTILTKSIIDNGKEL